jgi:predicted  nucleic acid-binding Zn-ribbon protein
VNPDLVVRDNNGKIYTVRYDAVNAMLLNEFLKEHRKLKKLEAAVARQHKDFQAAIAHEWEDMEAAVAQLTEQVQKVSAQLEAGKPAPQVVNNNQ